MKTVWDKYAEVLVDYSTNVQKGDTVQIRATSAEAKELVKAVYKRVLERGGHPIVRTSIADLSDIFIKYASDEQLDYVDPITKMEYETTGIRQLGKATKQLSEILMSRSARGEASWVVADFPTNALAQEAKMSLDEYTEFLIKSCYLDLDNPVAKLRELDEKQSKWANYLNNAKKVRITGEKTDITFGVAGRKWVSCSGLNNYPDGEVFTSPVEDDVNGEIYFDFPQNYRGNEAHGVHLWIENGQIVKAEADKGEDFLHAMLNMDEGSKGIGEIAIGTNDEIQEVTGNILFDEKIGGSIHMAVGASYPETGGKNVSGLHWDMIKNMKNGGKIYADDVLIYENGKMLI